MQKTTLLTIAVLGLLLLNLGTLGLLWSRQRAAGPVAWHPGPPPGPGRLIEQTLAFDADQLRQFERLREAHRRGADSLRVQGRELHRALYESLADSADAAGRTRVEQLIARIGANEATRARLNYDHFAQLRALCRPAQRARFGELMTRVADRFSGPGRPPGPPPGGGPPPGEGPPFGGPR